MTSLAAGSIRTRVAELSQGLCVQLGAVVRKTAEDHQPQRWRLGQRLDRCGHGDPRRAIGGETIDAGGNGRKGNRSKTAGLAKFDCAPVTRRQRLIFALVSAVPDRTHGVNHMPRRQPITPGDFGIAGCAAMECAAFRQQFRPGRTMDCTVHAAAAEQRTVRGVDDGVNAQRCSIGDGDFEPRRTDLARAQAQAVAGALRVTPLSAKSCCSSPAWNISRMMSQPPTNSPFT
jgi:hypothetical protein